MAEQDADTAKFGALRFLKECGLRVGYGNPRLQTSAGGDSADQQARHAQRQQKAGHEWVIDACRQKVGYFIGFEWFHSIIGNRIVFCLIAITRVADLEDFVREVLGHKVLFDRRVPKNDVGVIAAKMIAQQSHEGLPRYRFGYALDCRTRNFVKRQNHPAPLVCFVTWPHGTIQIRW